MIENDFEWEYLPELVGAIILLILMGIVYIILYSTLIYIFMAGIAYIVDETLPDWLPYIVLGMGTFSAMSKFYKGLNNK